MSLYLGMISGTSVDGIDCVLADIAPASCSLIAAKTTPLPEKLRHRVRKLIETPSPSWQLLGETDVMLGHCFADCALQLLRDHSVEIRDVAAIGHHGQTVHHHPTGPYAFTIQIGDPNVIAARTGITTIADFRRLDMAFGGQGAPLVPGFHDWVFRVPEESRVVVNIGGIANITVLQPDQATMGYDTGPGNTLLDLWSQRWQGVAFDDAGRWAASGKANEALLAALLEEPYFALPAPKSTGRELFNLAWLDRRLAAHAGDTSNRDVQATLTDLTARSIANAIRQSSPNCERVIVCGGGAYNGHLMSRLRTALGNIVETTAEHGIAPDWIEGLAFAWLAHARLEGIGSNVPTVTGARETVTLGGIYSSGTAPDPVRACDTTA
jgi:anhydro-N-acetylmuramic acid kinase